MTLSPRNEQQQQQQQQQQKRDNTCSHMPRTASLNSVQSDSPYHFYQTKVLEEYVRRPVNASTLRQYIFFGRQMTEERLVQAANWVRNELLVRLAHRIRDFQQLPFFVGTNPHIEFVYRLYWGAFEKLRKHPVIKNLDDNETFCTVLRDLLDDGQLVVPRIALGVTECASHYNDDESRELDRFVNRMLRSRISRRVLAEQHLALTHAFDNGWDLMGEGDGYVGIIFVRCSARDLVSRATELVHKHAETVYCKQRKPPQVILDLHQNTLVGHRQQAGDSDDIVFAYVPEHLEYILFELLNNAVRYTVKANQNDNSEYPPVRLTVSASETDVYFRISDQGGGMSQDRYTHLWSYQARAPNGDYRHFHKIHKMPSSITERASQAADLGQVHLGMGLPMSRIYAEYWGGELQVQTMEGYGTDVYVRIPRLGTKAENLGFEDDSSSMVDTKPMSRTAAPLQVSQGERHRKRHYKQNRYHPSIVQQQSSPYIPFSEGCGDGWSKSSMVRS